jgi:cytochrome P450
VPNDASVPPGPAERGGGIFESLRYGVSFFRDPFGFVGRRFARYGDVYFAPSQGVPLFVVRHPDHVREVLITKADAFAKSHSAIESLSVLLGEGLLTTDGEVWRRHRRILNPAFSRQAIAAAVPRMAQESRLTLDGLSVGRPFDAASAMTDLTLRIVGHSLLGIDLHDEVVLVGKAMNVLQTALAVPRSLPLPVRWPVSRAVDRAIHSLDGVIERVVAHRQHHPKAERDLLQMLLDATDPENHDVHLTAREVRDELVTFLLAGHETTSNTLAWALYLLAKHPDVLREAQREVDLVLGGREPASDDLEKLHLLDAILKETMRLYPPAYVLARRAVTDTSIGPWPVPRGSEVVVWIYFTHRDPRFFPEPTRFDPGRFSESEPAERTKLAYLPFGAGARACIGKVFATVEAKVALATLLGRFGFELRGQDRVTVKARITLTPKNLTLWPTARF